MTPAQMIDRIERCGLRLAADGPDILVTPAGRLTDPQKQWIRRHKDELLAVLRQPGRMIEVDGGNDLPASNDMAQPIMVEAFTPLGGRMLVRANSAEHAAWIRKMNPPPRRSS